MDNTQFPVLHPLTITAALPANDPQQLLTVNSSLSTDPDSVTTETGSLFVPQTPETFDYDEDGNLLSDGRFSYTWDAENRLIRAQTLPAAIQVGAFPVCIDYTYDHCRRIRKYVSKFVHQSWLLSESYNFLYDDWNLIREITTSHSAPLTLSSSYYTWGLDFSGSLQGVGGVGGLQLVIRDDGLYFPVYDANGNINGYANTSGLLVAKYEYSPFGETISQTGIFADIFSIRFSTKFYCAILKKIEYELRIYDPISGRWLNRDPLEEEGGINLYVFCFNNGINNVDLFGERSISFEMNIGGGLRDLAFI